MGNFSSPTPKFLTKSKVPKQTTFERTKINKFFLGQRDFRRKLSALFLTSGRSQFSLHMCHCICLLSDNPLFSIKQHLNYSFCTLRYGSFALRISFYKSHVRNNKTLTDTLEYKSTLTPKTILKMPNGQQVLEDLKALNQST